MVFYGPGMSGKTTNLEVIHQKVPDENKGEMTSIATEGDRTLFFDFLPLDLGKVRGMTTKFQLYTVPGQIYYASTRKLVLQGADGVIFVADSNPKKLDENIESLKDLADNLEEYGINIREVPLVIQWNKRDLPNAMAVEELEAKVNNVGAHTTEAVAATGEGVMATLKLAASLVLDRLNTKDGEAPPLTPKQAAAAAAASGTAAAPAAAPKEEAAAPKQDVFVAKVGADSISRTFFLQYCQMQYRLAARESELEDFKKFSKEEYRKYLESLINYSLLLQDAKKRAIKPPMEKVNAQIESFKKKFSGKAEMDEYLNKRRLSLDGLKNEAVKNEIINIMILEVIPNINERMKITEKEVADFYAGNKAKFNNKPFEELKEDLVNLIKSAKKRSALEEFYGKLRGQAEIKIFEDKL
jgi:hypothetical protein